MPRIVCALAALILLNGCAGYRLGTTLPEGLRSIYVPTIVNSTGEPDLEQAVTQAVIAEFQQDGTVDITTAENADLVLEATVTRYQLETIGFRSDRATTADEFRIRLYANIVVKRSADRSTFLRRSGVEGETTFILAGDMRSAKREALPGAAEDLAHDIVEAVVEHW